MYVIVNGVKYERRNANKSHPELDDFDWLRERVKGKSIAQASKAISKELGKTVRPNSIRHRIMDPLYPAEWRLEIRQERKHVI